MRTRYCSTRSRDVMRPCSIAARRAGIVASTTVNGWRAAGAAARFDCADGDSVATASTSAIELTSGFMPGIIIDTQARSIENKRRIIALMSLDPTWLFLSMIPGGIGFVLFVYGRKQGRWVMAISGLTFMIYPYF